MHVFGPVHDVGPPPTASHFRAWGIGGQVSKTENSGLPASGRWPLGELGRVLLRMIILPFSNLKSRGKIEHFGARRVVLTHSSSNTIISTTAAPFSLSQADLDSSRRSAGHDTQHAQKTRQIKLRLLVGLVPFRTQIAHDADTRPLQFAMAPTWRDHGQGRVVVWR